MDLGSNCTLDNMGTLSPPPLDRHTPPDRNNCEVGGGEGRSGSFMHVQWLDRPLNEQITYTKEQSNVGLSKNP